MDRELYYDALTNTAWFYHYGAEEPYSPTRMVTKASAQRISDLTYKASYKFTFMTPATIVISPVKARSERPGQ